VIICQNYILEKYVDFWCLDTLCFQEDTKIYYWKWESSGSFADLLGQSGYGIYRQSWSSIASLADSCFNWPILLNHTCFEWYYLLKHVEQSRNSGIINCPTQLHFVGYFYKICIMMHRLFLYDLYYDNRMHERQVHGLTWDSIHRSVTLNLRYHMLIKMIPRSIDKQDNHRLQIFGSSKSSVLLYTLYGFC
jgi:hypothetical protein